MTDAPVRSVAMVTGHRPQHLDPDSIPWIRQELARVAAKLRAEHATTTMISGMALGADMLWAGIACRQSAALRAHVPFPQQPNVWHNPELRQQWRNLVDYADRTGGVVIYGDLDGYTDVERKAAAVRLLHDRNKGMIRETMAAAGVVVAVLRRSRTEGGTWSAYNKALEAGAPIIRVDPDQRTVTMASAGRGSPNE